MKVAHAWFALLCFAVPVLARNDPSAKPAPAPVTREDAIKREQRLFEADQKHDMDIINSIVADDFVDIARDGGMIGKQALLKEIPTIKMIGYSQKNWDFDSMGPYAYSISYDSDATVMHDNSPTHSQNHLNSVWIYRDGRWQMLLHSRGGGEKAAATK